MYLDHEFPRTQSITNHDISFHPHIQANAQRLHRYPFNGFQLPLRNFVFVKLFQKLCDKTTELNSYEITKKNAHIVPCRKTTTSVLNLY